MKAEEQVCKGEIVTIKMKDSWLGKDLQLINYIKKNWSYQRHLMELI